MKKRIHHKEVREEMMRMQSLGNTGRVRIDILNPMYDDLNIGVNWSSIGTVSLEEAQEFINELQKAVDVAKTFKYEDCERYFD